LSAKVLCKAHPLPSGAAEIAELCVTLFEYVNLRQTTSLAYFENLIDAIEKPENPLMQ
jgi:hypothetical protein